MVNTNYVLSDNNPVTVGYNKSTTVSPLSNGQTSAFSNSGAGTVGTHTAYQTDNKGNRVEVTYDSTGKIVSSRKVGNSVGSEYSSAGNGGGVTGTNTNSAVNTNNWNKLISLLKSMLGYN